MRPQAVTFDFHNTLARCDRWFQLEIRDLVPAFLRWHARQASSTVSDATLDLSVELYRKLRLDIMRHGVEQDAANCVNVVTRELGLEFEPETIERGLHDVMYAALDDSQPIEGVVAAVHALREKGIKLGVVSSAVYHPFLEWSLEKFGIDDAFEIIVTSASCGFYKSRTEIYEIALSALSVTAERAVHVGDSHRFDVETARKLGMQTIWLDEGDEATDSHRADVVVTSLAGVDLILLNGSPESRS
jgi:HAD superfamily hydrolase (TIGR01509 family)